MVDLHCVEGFDRDSGNARKNEKHGVTQSEAEQVFMNEPLLLLPDSSHSRNEPRFYALGISSEKRMLSITFTVRDNGKKIRIISARLMHRKERSMYEQNKA